MILTENPEVNGQLAIAVPALTMVQKELDAAEARLVTLEPAGNNVPQRLKIDDATLLYDSTQSLHIGADKIMAGRGNIGLVDSINLLVRGDVSGSRIKADLATERDPLTSSMSARPAPGSAPWRS